MFWVSVQKLHGVRMTHSVGLVLVRTEDGSLAVEYKVRVSPRVRDMAH